MRYLLYALILLAVLIVGAAIYFRTVQMPVETWHVDPATATPPSSPNFDLRQGDSALLFEGVSKADLAQQIAATVDADGATLLAGSLEGDYATYIQRTRLMGYPDAISIRLTEIENGTRAEVFSRSRFGYSDWGVNAARVARWFANTP